MYKTFLITNFTIFNFYRKVNIFIEIDKKLQKPKTFYLKFKMADTYGSQRDGAFCLG